MTAYNAVGLDEDIERLQVADVYLTGQWIRLQPEPISYQRHSEG